MGDEDGPSEEEDGGQRSVHGTLKPGSSHGNQTPIRNMGLRTPAMTILRGELRICKQGGCQDGIFPSSTIGWNLKISFLSSSFFFSSPSPPPSPKGGREAFGFSG